MLRNPGSIWDEAMKLYPLFGGRAKISTLDFDFPSGARISFRYLDRPATKYAYQGSAFAFIAWDETTHFDEESWFYLFSRLRSMSGINPYVRATCNPDCDHWLARMVDWWIDKDGYAIPEKSGAIRYFYRVSGEIYWADTVEELKERFPQMALISEPLSFTFIPASLEDNLALLSVNPSYKANLLALHPVERERLLMGNWRIRMEAGLVFDRTWFKIVESLPRSPSAEVRFWDLAATAKEVAGKDACYTAGLRLARLDDDFYVIDCSVLQKRAGDVELSIRSAAVMDGQGVKVRFELEGGSSGLIVEEKLKSDIYQNHPSFDVKGIRPMGDKLTRALPVAAAAAQGRVYLVRDVWNTQFLNACENFDGGNKATPPTNDIVDALSGAYTALVSEVDLQFNGALGQVKTGDIRARRRR